MNIIEALDDQNLFAPWFPGATWNAWRAILKAAFALPMSGDEIAFFRSVADRDPPAEQVQELWIVAGRRGGKDSIASVIAAHAAALFRESGQLRPGERALVMCLANDRDQAKIVLNYARAYFTDIPLLQGMVERQTASGFGGGLHASADRNDHGPLTEDSASDPRALSRANPRPRRTGDHEFRELTTNKVCKPTANQHRRGERPERKTRCQSMK